MSKYAERHNALLDTLGDAAASIKQAEYDMGGEKIGASMLEAVANIAQARTTLEEAERRAVTQARSAGTTWEEIGYALGTSRQSAHEQYRSVEA